MIKKLPLQSVNFEGDLKDFKYISLFEPPSSSLYLSLGLTILESLIRLKSSPELTHPTWLSLFQAISSTKSIAHYSALSEQHSEFKNIAALLNNCERKQAYKLLESYSNSYEQLAAIDYGMRFIVKHYLNADVEMILQGKFKNYSEIFRKICENLHLGIGIGNAGRLKEYKTHMTGPMIFLYLKEREQFGMMYHQAVKYADEKLEFTSADLSVYPFTTKRQENKQANNIDSDCILDLLEILAENLKSEIPRSVKKHIQEKIDIICKSIPGIKDIPALIRLDLENIDSPIRETPDIFKHSSYNLYSTNALSNMPNRTTYSHLSKKTRKATSTSIKKRKANSTDYYRDILKEPVISPKKCRYCNKSGGFSEFSLISCKQHSICMKCRSKHYSEGNYSCPECDRSYTVREHSLLKINDTSNRITKKLPKYF